MSRRPFDEPSRARMCVRSTDDGDELGRLRFCTDRGGVVTMTHERLSITSRIWFEYQSRLPSRLLHSCACPPSHRSFPSHVVLSHIISPLPPIFCFVCSSELLVHNRLHHVYAFPIFCYVGLRVCISLLHLHLHCATVSFTCHIAPSAPNFQFTYTFSARRVRYALSCINNLVPLPLLFLISFHSC